MRCRPGQSEAARPHRAGTRLIASLYSFYVSRIMACRVCFPEPGPSTWQNLLTCVVCAPCIWTAFPYATRIRGCRRAWPPCVPSSRACPAAWLHPRGARSAPYGVARGRHRRGHVLGSHMVGRPIGGRPRAHAGPLQDPRRHRRGTNGVHTADRMVGAASRTSCPEHPCGRSGLYQRMPRQNRRESFGRYAGPALFVRPPWRPGLEWYAGRVHQRPRWRGAHMRHPTGGRAPAECGRGSASRNVPGSAPHERVYCDRRPQRRPYSLA